MKRNETLDSRVRPACRIRHLGYGLVRVHHPFWVCRPTRTWTGVRTLGASWLALVAKPYPHVPSPGLGGGVHYRPAP